MQILKCCVGGRAGIWEGFQHDDDEEEPPFTLEQLLELGAEAPLTAACERVAALSKQRHVDARILSGLQGNLLTVFDLVAAGDEDGRGAPWPASLVKAHIEVVMQVCGCGCVLRGEVGWGGVGVIVLTPDHPGHCTALCCHHSTPAAVRACIHHQ